MKSIVHAFVIVSAVALAGCATSQKVLLAKQAPTRVVTVAQVPEDGNSPEMDATLRSALVKEGFSVRAPLPAGTRKSDQVDATISYIDVWRWDIVMYLQSVAINMFDARTGDLLVTANWKNSAFHGFQDEGTVVSQLVGEMAAKLQAATGDTTTIPTAENDASNIAADAAD